MYAIIYTFFLSSEVNYVETFAFLTPRTQKGNQDQSWFYYEKTKIKRCARHKAEIKYTCFIMW